MINKKSKRQDKKSEIEGNSKIKKEKNVKKYKIKKIYEKEGVS